MRRTVQLVNDKKTIQRVETALLRSMTQQESLQHWLQLQAAFEWQLLQTANLFAEARYKAMTELQTRLRKLQD